MKTRNIYLRTLTAQVVKAQGLSGFAFSSQNHVNARSRTETSAAL